MKAVFMIIKKDDAKKMIDEAPSEKIKFFNYTAEDAGGLNITKEYGKQMIEIHTGVVVFSNTPAVGSLEFYNTSFIDLKNINVCPTKSILFPLKFEDKKGGICYGSFK